VSAYKPGDFRTFFADPRTRAEYLRWAPLLLEAEEYHAGNREIAPVKPLPPRVKTKDGALEYQRRKRLKALVGATVRLARDVHMKSGKVYKKDTLWRVSHVERGKICVQGILSNGKSGSDRAIYGLSERDVHPFTLGEP